MDLLQNRENIKELVNGLNFKQKVDRSLALIEQAYRNNSVTTEVFHSIPREAREAVISLGTTKWEMIKHVLLRLARRGIVASVALGLSRA